MVVTGFLCCVRLGIIITTRRRRRRKMDGEEEGKKKRWVDKSAAQEFNDWVCETMAF